MTPCQSFLPPNGHLFSIRNAQSKYDTTLNSDMNHILAYNDFNLLNVLVLATTGNVRWSKLGESIADTMKAGSGDSVA